MCIRDSRSKFLVHGKDVVEKEHQKYNPYGEKRKNNGINRLYLQSFESFCMDIKVYENIGEDDAGQTLVIKKRRGENKALFVHFQICKCTEKTGKKLNQQDNDLVFYPENKTLFEPKRRNKEKIKETECHVAGDDIRKHGNRRNDQIDP